MTLDIKKIEPWIGRIEPWQRKLLHKRLREQLAERIPVGYPNYQDFDEALDSAKRIAGDDPLATTFVTATTTFVTAVDIRYGKQLVNMENVTMVRRYPDASRVVISFLHSSPQELIMTDESYDDLIEQVMR